jgi:hypothetical protein
MDTSSLQQENAAPTNKRAASDLGPDLNLSPDERRSPKLQTLDHGIPRDRPPRTSQLSLGKNPPLDYIEPEDSVSSSPPLSPTFITDEEAPPLILQPETRPITQDQLVNETKGIYAGLVMVERKCVEVPYPPASFNTQLTNIYCTGRPATEYND